ncbi:MAG: TraU family protein [Methylococcaceae bacterium]
MKKFRSLLIQLLLFSSLLMPLNSNAVDAACYGKFVDFFTDICYDCAFPIKLMGLTIGTDEGEDVKTFDPATSGGCLGIPGLCQCTSLVKGIQCGVPTSFWEPARQVDVTRTPFCMVSLGTMMNVSIGADMYGANSPHNKKLGQHEYFRHTHFYINPVMGLLEIALDNNCLEPRGFDISYMSELDPTWADEEMARLLVPEAYLFGNIAATLACAADCVAASTGMSNISNSLFWCSGCQGELYPLSGTAKDISSDVQMSSLMTHRITAKLHRMLVTFSTQGVDAMCGIGKPEITMDKREYKYSMIYPMPQSSPVALGGSTLMTCCQPFGRTTVLWAPGRSIPTIGEDHAYMLFRKRDCCSIR